jgi:hypothetical protein
MPLLRGNQTKIRGEGMRKVMLLSVVVSLALLLGGCATILSGSTQKINLQAERGTTCNAVVDGQKATVPSIIDVKRENKDKIITVQECPSEQLLLHKEINPVFFVNILSGGVFGSTTDYASGSMWKYQPENVKVDCLPKP